MHKAATQLSAYQKAMKYLVRREYAAVELKRKLAGLYSNEEIDEALAQLQAKDWQSDQRFAESRVRYRSQQGYGPDYIGKELAGFNIKSEQVRIALYQQEIDWQLVAVTIYKKRFKNKAAATWPEKQKQMNYLRRRGFSIEIIKAIVAEI